MLLSDISDIIDEDELQKAQAKQRDNKNLILPEVSVDI